MKLKIKYYLSIATVVLLYILIKNWNINFTLQDNIKNKITNVQVSQDIQGTIEKEITLVFRYSYDTSKYLANTINTFLTAFPFITIIIVSDMVIPKEVMQSVSNTTRVKNIPLKLDLLNFIVDRNIANHVKTRYLFIVPVGVVSLSGIEILNIIKLIGHHKSSIIAIPINKKQFKCLKLELNLIQWTIQYKKNEYSAYCDVIQGDHGIFMLSKTLQRIGEPFILPFPEAFYIQSTFLKIKVMPVYHIKFNSKHKDNRRSDSDLKIQIQRQVMNKLLKIKKVIRENGVVEWYGCTRDSQRCFPNIINSVPDYLNQGRWTPPCCLKVLRETVHHVFNELKKWNVTFWLEGGSLLGAMRMKDIIPWDYDVDIGIYLKDVDKCPWLQKIHIKNFQERKLPSVIDTEGFVWEKASLEEGDFYRVQASVHNRLHIDIFPFFAKNGVMTKNTWFTGHPQDMEFPEHYLKPLTTIEFAGIEAPAPNNVKEFLELKFGKGCVENPQYPNPNLLPFPKQVKKFVVNESDSYDSSTILP